MCWTSTKKPVLRRAEEPIPVFKILFRDMESVYMHFRYHLHIKYSQRLETPRNMISRYSIFEGIHSYDAEMSFIKDHSDDSHYFIVATKRDDLYLDTFLKSLFNLENAYIQVMGVIPEGAEYYRNEWGEIVSDSIILTEIKEII